MKDFEKKIFERMIGQRKLTIMPPYFFKNFDEIPLTKELPGKATTLKLPWWQKLLGWHKPKKI